MDFTITNGGLKWTDVDGKKRSLSAGNIIPKNRAGDNTIIDLITTYSGDPAYPLTDSDGNFGVHTIDTNPMADVQAFSDYCLQNGFGQ